MRDQQKLQQVFLVVLESGAKWPASFDCGDLTDVHVIAQQSGEASLAFYDRLCERVRRTRRTGGRIASATLLLNERFTESDSVRRRLIAGLLRSAIGQVDDVEPALRRPESALPTRTVAQELDNEIERKRSLSLEAAYRKSSERFAKSKSSSGVYSKAGVLGERMKQSG
jgi:hypothetical protein